MTKKILIVDDEEEIVVMLTKQFEAHGFEIVSAPDGKAGLELAQSLKPDLLILDEMMPKMDGYKVAALLKNDTRFKNLPIIMFSARAEESAHPLSKEVGVDVYLTKMTDFDALLKTVLDLTEGTGSS